MHQVLKIAAVLCLCASPALPESIERMPDPVLLPGGQAVAVPGAEATLVLIGVIDQRCPPELACYWEGMMRVEVEVTTPAGTETVILCNLCDDGQETAQSGGLALRLAGLGPTTEELAMLARVAVLADYTASVFVEVLAP